MQNNATKTKTWCVAFLLSCLTVFMWPLHSLAESTLLENSSNNQVVLRVGLPSYNMVPYSYQHQTPSGNIVSEGLLISMLDEVSANAGFKYQIELYPTFSGVLSAFEKGELDLLVGVSSTKERQEYMTFSEPMFSIRRAVITQNLKINDLSELATVNLALEKGFALNDLLPSLLPESRITTLDSTQAAFTAVEENHVDAYIGDALSLSALLREQPKDSLTLSVLPDLPADHLHFAVKKGKHKLLSRINFALEDIKQDSLQSIYNQWLAPSQHSMLLDYGTLNLTQDEKNWLDKNPSIPVGTHSNWYPYDFTNEQQQHSGLSADVLNLISNVLGVSFESTTYLTPEAAEVAFNNGETMVLTNITPTTDKARYMDFTQAYSFEPWVLLSRSDRLGNFAPSGTEAIGVIEDSGGTTVLPSLCLTCQAVPYINHVSAFQALQKDEISFALASLHHAAPLLHQDYVGQFKITGTINEQNSAPLALAVNFRHPMLLSILNKAIGALPANELERLGNKWLTYEYQEGLSPREVAKWSVIIGLGIFVVIFVIVFWNRKMAAEIEQRKVAEQRAKAAEAHLQTLADNIDGVVLKHIQTNPKQPLNIQFSFVSAGVTDMFSLSVDSVKEHPQHLFELISKEDMPQFEASMLDAIETGHWESEQQVQLESGELKWVKFNSQVSNGHAIVWNTVITDITLLKKQQQALDNARQKAESATAAKSQFLATISHEVRTPISGILGLLELMQEHQLSEELLNLHGGLNQSARNLLHIVNDVLDYSKIEAGKLELNPTEIELGKVLARIVQPQSIHAQQKGLAFHYWQDPNLAQWLFADDIRLHQILNNFLNNAIKFTEHGTISLHVDVIEKNKHQQKISLTVSDTGIGIPKDRQQSLFQPFEQADKTTSRRFGGTGLGLSIALKLIEQMNGTIDLSSEEGKGSHFTVTVTLPTCTPEQAVSNTLALSQTLLCTSEAENSIGLDVGNHSHEVYVVGYVLQQEELCRYLKHFGLEPKVLHINQKHLLKEMVAKHQPKHIFVAMSVWQQLAITDAWIQQHANSTRFTVINQNPMLSPEPLGNSWCLSVNPLLPDNLVHVLTKPVSHDNLTSPLDNETKVPISTETREQAELNGRLILVAEDHPINQQVIAKQLENIGVHADIVDNGVLALNALKDKRYGLLLTDCHMPEMDGYTLTSSIRQIEQRKEELNQETQRLPIVALTANAVQGEDANCYAHGMDDFLVKPVSIKQMKLTIEKWLPAINDSVPTPEYDISDSEKPDSHSQDTSSSSDSLPADQEANEFSMLFQDIEQSFAEVEISNPSEPSQEVTPASPQDSFNLTNNQVIDYAALYDLFEDHDVVMTLLDEFAASFIEDNERIKTYWASKEYKELKTTAHRLKGAAKMVACDRIASPLAIIEARANDLVTEDTDLEQVESKIEASIEEVNSTFERFTEEINQLRQTKEKAYSYE
ncbi:two-component system, NarL family, sensor histidine kinase EvgS [Vibrio crassostreae]|uniref:transporter substrate-binding domain-containing protein n=1 Tax=Vibrio crassostreae TaxID=246167 RepID=UPI001BD3B2FC|nr:transporter substrate-binding domain-containing protein [Vibrio crassostreae]CAK1829728.1 two-component system, NarL family, sensor histidine kinase EvgS [Vibrio crassostreae]CAK1835956.1 two-component system, NarL family, sensor histidine kinase EvgS [Vibrio crassostreae]CAK2280056.1 two-component system, NarL family, sensor histidine kinase EvgS [Vibrio crassostreae]CAK2390240.1 two-component system, NarL family, sensor histidine kinase EvgS [Vibrio crassostreae]CAK2599776.1 two-component